MGAYTPVLVSVRTFNAYISSSLGVGVCTDGMFGVGNELVVEVVAGLTKAVCNCVQTAVALAFQIVNLIFD